MSFQQLPTELFLQIVGYLHNEDRDCIRITCRKFKSYLLCSRCPKLRPGIATDNCQALRDDGDVTSRLNFLTRLFLPGNVFHEKVSDVAICGRCCVVRPSAKFPLDIIRDGYRTCEHCIVTIMGEDMDVGSWMVYNCKRYCVCMRCLEFISEDRIHSHDITSESSTTGAVESVCIDCHFESCYDIQCGGWTAKWILKAPWHFCTGSNSDYNSDTESGCGECGSCFTIEMMKRSQDREQE